MDLVVGIDLGTTYSAIAHLPQTGKPEIIPVDNGHPTMPSVICFRDGEVLTGREAKEYQDMNIYPVAAFFKRVMGDTLYSFAAGSKEYSATELSALILKRLKADAELHMEQTITHAVITVPAYFRDHERKATIEAGRMAGLNVLRVINEPTAAAVAYGMRGGHEHKKLMVYDLGGGTFDVTFLECHRDNIKVLSSDGDHLLGGKDWDDRIVQFIGSSFEEEFFVDPLEDLDTRLELLHQAEKAKKALSERRTAKISFFYQGNRGRYTLERDTFEQLTHDLMERTTSITHRVIQDSGYRIEDLDGILLVGGSTRMPMVHQFVEQLLGKPPTTGLNVDEAIAMGAAIVAREAYERSKSAKPAFRLAGLPKTRDVTNHSLGMIAVNADNSAYLNSIILPKNKEIPCQETRPYKQRTRRSGNNCIEIFMTQGESEEPCDISYIGHYMVNGIPHQKGETIIDITYRYDVNGIVEVEALPRGMDIPLKVTVDPLPDDVPERFLQPPEEVLVPEHSTIYLAFDLSGSMSGEPLREAKNAAHAFLEDIDLGHSSLGIIGFSDSVAVKLQASQNAKKIEAAINSLSCGETGYCNDTDPFEEGLALLQGTPGLRVMVVLADGVWSNQSRAVKRAKCCHDKEIEIISIGFGGADEGFLREVASQEDASFFTEQNQLVATFRTIAQVLTESPQGIAMNRNALAHLRKG